jgi:hypothetical protein
MKIGFHAKQRHAVCGACSEIADGWLADSATTLREVGKNGTAAAM